MEDIVKNVEVLSVVVLYQGWFDVFVYFTAKMSDRRIVPPSEHIGTLGNQYLVT